MADIVQAEYETLENIAKKFLQLQNDNEAIISTITSIFSQLQTEGWKGRAADKFFVEMETELIPALNRATSAFDFAEKTTMQIMDVIQFAEQEAANQFEITSDSGATGGSGFTSPQSTTRPFVQQASFIPPQAIPFVAQAEIPTDVVSASETADKINDLLSYGLFDWRVSGNEQQQALDLLKNSDDLNAVIAELDRDGNLDTLISRIESPQQRLELMRLLGSGLDPAGKASVLPHIQDLGMDAEIQYHLGELGLPINSTQFDRTPYGNLISDDSGAPFTGVGATGVNPQENGVGLIDSIRLGLGSESAIDKYDNPLGGLGTYLNGLTTDERHRQVELLVNQPISSEPTSVITTPNGAVILPGLADSYAGNLPSRGDIIEIAANKYNLEPELLTAFIMAEQRDQTAFEDAKDYSAATSILEGNTSIGLGQVVVSTARDNDLFSAILSEETRSNLSHSQIASLLASDEANIFAAAQYMRQVADQGATFNPTTIDPQITSDFPGIDLAAYSQHSSTWPPDNIRALASEYTSAPWDDFTSPGWGFFVYEAYQDTQGSNVFNP